MRKNVLTMGDNDKGKTQKLVANGAEAWVSYRSPCRFHTHPFRSQGPRKTTRCEIRHNSWYNYRGRSIHLPRKTGLYIA